MYYNINKLTNDLENKKCCFYVLMKIKTNNKLILKYSKKY